MSKKLHELLAVGGSVETQALKCGAELKETFLKKHHLFIARLVTLTHVEVGKAPETEEKVEIQSTVPKELAWIGGFYKSMINLDGQINLANTQAKADIILSDGTPLAKDVPATMLLELEKRIKLFQDIVAAAPTLDPAKGFVPDPPNGVGMYKAREITSATTLKTQVPLELSPATDKHPAQVQLVSKDVVTGSRLKQEWSSMITSADKAALLDRCEGLSRAVRAARSRANDQLVNVDNKLGDLIIDFILSK